MKFSTLILKFPTKTLVRAILSVGNFEVIKQLVCGSDGQKEQFEYYASQLKLEEAESTVRWNKARELPKYVIGILSPFPPPQTPLSLLRP